MAKSMESFGLDSRNPFHQAGWEIGNELEKRGAIYQFDVSIIMLIIQILQALERYRPQCVCSRGDQ
jgi:hypothetical protein